MNQQEKLKAAKNFTQERLKSFTSDAIQIDEFKWASLEEVEDQEVWVVCALTAKKNFDVDEAIEDWEDKKKMAAEKEKVKNKKKN